jgi:prepilin signal peptidase PulO-like enzyme (type II secretory pathway)
MISLHYTITKEDYVSFYTYMYWDKKSRRKTRWRNLLKQLIIFLLFLSILFFSKSIYFLGKLSPIFLIFIVGSALFPLFTGKQKLVKQAERITENPENDSIFKDVILNASDADVNMRSELVQVTYNWKSFIKKIETADYYYLFQNELQAIIIPKRSFKNNEEKSTFDKILSRNLTLDAEVSDELN